MPQFAHKRYPLLAPLSLFYGMGSWIYNKLYDKGILKSYFSSIPTICVGNIAVGGTGKTPMVEALIEHFSPQYRIAVLSRGYKRSSRGMVIASKNATAKEIGDEPYQMLQKYPDTCFVLSANRKKALLYLESLPEEIRPQLILLDDGFQHRAIRPFLSIVLTAFHAPFLQDKLLPWGRLREPISSLLRTHCVVVTKCPSSLSITERKMIARKMGLFQNQPIFFSHIHYKEPYPLFSTKEEVYHHSNPLLCDTARIALLAGTADPSSFFTKARKLYSSIVAMKSLPDHYRYNKKNIALIERFFEESKANILLTTEKDASKLVALKQELSPSLRESIYCLPICVSFFNHKGSQFFPFMEEALLKYPQPCNTL